MLEKHSTWYVILIAVSAGMAGLLYGFDTAVISGAIGYLQELYDLSPAMEGWVISCVMIGGVIGVVTSGFLSDRYGRKNIMMVAAILFIISALGSAFATSVAMLVWARIIGGFGIGFASALSVTYISECAPPAIRGRLGSLYQLFTIIGICATFYINYSVANSGSYAWVSRPFNYIQNRRVKIIQVCRLIRQTCFSFGSLDRQLRILLNGEAVDPILLSQ
ncbi:Arabinose transporter [Halobacillus karajensis]|uniref:Arabinose transporter n=1 Tax=Halobacillus karajensis TaxID=195088 RepID=A0A024PB74_9BACI|nr:Arabinose transporter [Halobacillus karajensis]CDQ25667.1 Arabinose transporter [Halobacillus karajensis]CDQ25938.1 Arabinose transporter [Halobacillus karajensis]